ncbi:MAG: hypothetical protein WD960_13870, partial [Gemmatimonadota bacterium]
QGARFFAFLMDQLWGADQDTFDVYNAMGQYMGLVTMPFALGMYPSPIVRAGRLYGVTRDDLGVEYVVVARVS